MKANALRIGNFVWDNYSGEMIVHNINAEYHCIDLIKQNGLPSGRYDIESIEPIPLTEEWLVRFGFTKCNNTKVSDSFYLIYVGGSEFYINPDNGVVWIHRNKNIINNPCLIVFVHSLQNLYFALTGEELTLINLPIDKRN